jgi:hypothetical protein
MLKIAQKLWWPVNCDLYINGDKQTESYIKDKSKLFSNSCIDKMAYLLYEGSLVMGDNRPGSLTVESSTGEAGSDHWSRFPISTYWFWWLIGQSETK